MSGRRPNLPSAVFGAGLAVSNVAEAAAGVLVGAAPEGAPDFIGTENGELIPIPRGAQGPSPAYNGKGIQYTGGSGGNGLADTASDVRIMDSTPPKPPSPGYPKGYVNYTNAGNQSINPYTGQTVDKYSDWWHIGLK
jgi:hypothetical protein